MTARPRARSGWHPGRALAQDDRPAACSFRMTRRRWPTVRRGGRSWRT